MRFSTTANRLTEEQGDDEVNLEPIATPAPQPSAQMRYASLHRAIERGLASDATYRDLVKACLELELTGEALDAFRHIQSVTERAIAQRALCRAGLMEAPKAPQQELVTEDDLRPTLIDEVVDAGRFLTEGHLPMTVAITTICFPVMIGLGGALTASSHPALFPAVAIVPLVFVIGLIGTLCRRVLTEATQGLEDAPELPDSSSMLRESGHFLASVAAIGLPLLGLPLLLSAAGARTLEIALALVVAAVLIPIALLLRETSSNWSALHPRHLVGGIYHGGSAYVGVAAIFVALLAPASLCTVATQAADAHIQLAVVGPVLIAPLLIAMRLLGRFAYLQRAQLAAVLDAIHAQPVDDPAAAPAHPHTPLRSRTAAPGAHATSGPTQPVKRTPVRKAVTPPPAHPPRRGQPAASTTMPPRTPNTARRPIADSAPKRRTAAGSTRTSGHRAPAPRPVDAAVDVNPQVGQEPQDLTQMPGFRVVRGEDRVRLGAAARIEIGRQRPPQ